MKLGIKSWLGLSFVLLAAAVLALLYTEPGARAIRAALEAGVRSGKLSVRQMVFLENPELMQAIARGGAFGGDFSRAVAQGMFTRSGKAVEDALEMTRIEEVAPRSWLIRLPIVNAVLFETDEGLVLVDTGMAPAGPAVLAAIREVSDAPPRQA
jgi:hypothetical protein